MNRVFPPACAGTQTGLPRRQGGKVPAAAQIYVGMHKPESSLFLNAWALRDVHWIIDFSIPSKAAG